MNFTRGKALAVYFVCMLFTLFSVSVSAAETGEAQAGIYIDGWSVFGDQDIPVISFEDATLLDELAQDIRVENVTRNGDSSIRFQLSHSGPLSRQVFANVSRIEQDDGFTRSIITNIADGLQTEYLSITAELAPVRNGGKIKDAGWSDELESKNGQKPECLSCLIYIAYRVSCARAETRAFQQCRTTCQRLGGVRHFDSGSCGAAQLECICFTQPPRDTRTFYEP